MPSKVICLTEAVIILTVTFCSADVMGAGGGGGLGL